MKIILGLGNPEQKYSRTRHNVGFWALDTLATHYNSEFKPERKFKALVAATTIAGEKTLLVKPQTYYNEVGESARALIDFYKLNEADVCVVHDDLALPLGTIRTRIGGSSGGNNGLKSLEAHIGQATARIRIGVWTEQHHGVDKVDVVLGKLSKEEQDTLHAQSATVLSIVSSFCKGIFETTTHR
jgi:PTH1 family peptidyl-tRNA hydrolase